MFKKLSVPKLYKVRRLRHHQTCYQTSGNRKRKIWPDFYVVWTLSPGCWCQGVHIWGQKSKNMTTLPTGHAVSLFVRLISCQFSFLLIPSSSVPSTLPSPLSRKLPAVTRILHSLTACKMTSWGFSESLLQKSMCILLSTTNRKKAIFIDISDFISEEHRDIKCICRRRPRWIRLFEVQV